MNDPEQIRVEVADGILTVTLHRPETMNAFTAQMMRELIAAFDQADADYELDRPDPRQAAAR